MSISTRGDEGAGRRKPASAASGMPDRPSDTYGQIGEQNPFKVPRVDKYDLEPIPDPWEIYDREQHRFWKGLAWGVLFSTILWGIIFGVAYAAT